ncbi:AAA family ATPase [Methylobacterium sp. Leaf466]|uniref:AAA family ATPase n=1 Tax=Methylobacterium sp. Leaf466 TaxID=1736386 RepID=UPI0006F4BDE7|nr:AAA family ATPase [Methylobacterium sp. Leaf466]KQT80556.1 ATPase [Methylobacterium sp. Leaf466]
MPTVSQDDLLELVDAALAADYTRVRRAGSKIAGELDDENAARALRALIRRKGVPLRASGYAESLPVDGKSRLPLIEEQPWPTTPVFLSDTNGAVVTSFLEDVRNADLLSSKGLSTRLSMLLAGPPGTGKTLLAGHVAAQLGRPLYTVRLDSVISSLLGDTAKNIRSIFDFVPAREAVLFIDEMDAVAKVRDDRHELGELKRVVNTVIQGLDSLDDRAVVLAATNHPQLLDPAIWRRFPYKVDLGLPDASARADLWRHFLFEGNVVAEQLTQALAAVAEGLSGADIQNIALSARRHAALAGGSVDAGSVVWAVLQSRKGQLTLPTRLGVPADHRKELALHLSGAAVKAIDIARLLGVTRQTVGAYLKETGRAA